QPPHDHRHRRGPREDRQQRDAPPRRVMRGQRYRNHRGWYTRAHAPPPRRITFRLRFHPVTQPPGKSLMRSLGEFFGHIVRAVRTDPSGAQRREVRREVEEETRDTPAGKVPPRRTTIEEVEPPPDKPQPGSERPKSEE